MNNHLDMNSFLTAYAYKIINEYLPAGPRDGRIFLIVYSNRQQDNIMIYLHCFEHTALKRQMIGNTASRPLGENCNHLSLGVFNNFPQHPLSISG